ncbi:MAG: hypothetical protein IPO15_21235 [Anaerolineae bacterium]|uniref:hypothetical protein n=1 Tax=Candidatus Amarolinea dominans TaxID=3140696 RepID=UPI0031371BF9|nr:hypothetical protein [Anaerolineae bacterium]
MTQPVTGMVNAYAARPDLGGAVSIPSAAPYTRISTNQYLVVGAVTTVSPFAVQLASPLARPACSRAVSWSLALLAAAAGLLVARRTVRSHSRIGPCVRALTWRQLVCARSACECPGQIACRRSHTSDTVSS